MPDDLQFMQPQASCVCLSKLCLLTHWGRVTHICDSKQTIIGLYNGLLPGWHQAIIWTNYGILLIGPLGTNFSEISMEIDTFSFKKMHLKVFGKCQPFCLGPNVLTHCGPVISYGISSLGHHSFRYCWQSGQSCAEIRTFAHLFFKLTHVTRTNDVLSSMKTCRNEIYIRILYIPFQLRMMSFLNDCRRILCRSHHVKYNIFCF